MNFLADILVKEYLNQKYIVYFDVDNTLTDYWEKMSEMGIEPKDTTKDENIEFWEDAIWIPGSKEMLKFSQQHFQTLILTASANKPAPIKGKSKWIRNNIGDIPILFVNSGPKKIKYSGKDRILIDDKAENIRAWEKGGGIGILFTNPEEVIDKLKSLIPKEKEVETQDIEDWFKDQDDWDMDNEFYYEINETKKEQVDFEGEDPIKFLNYVTNYCCEDLNIPRPKVTLLNSLDFTQENNSFACYIPGEYEIKVVIKGRNLSDCARSLSHELKHAEQDHNDRLTATAGEDGDDFENEANQYSGKTMRHLNRTYPWILTTII